MVNRLTKFDSKKQYKIKEGVKPEEVINQLAEYENCLDFYELEIEKLPKRYDIDVKIDIKFMRETSVCCLNSVFKLGIDPTVIFEALEKGYYAKDGSGITRVVSIPGIAYRHDLYFCQADQKFHIYSENGYGTQVDNLVENYGKTSALTKEEL